VPRLSSVFAAASQWSFGFHHFSVHEEA